MTEDRRVETTGNENRGYMENVDDSGMMTTIEEIEETIHKMP